MPRAVAMAARRPACWIAAAVAAVALAWSAWPQAPAGGCLFLVVLACLAAVGDAPIGLLPPGGRGRSFEVGVWVLARGLWPVAGLGLALAVGGRQALLPAALAAAVALLAMASYGVSRGCGAKAADAAAIVIVLAALAAGATVLVTGSAAARAGTAALVWLVVGGLAWACWWTDRAGDPLWGRSGAGAAPRDGERAGVAPLPASGGLRRWLGRLAMLTALVGMAAWLMPASPAAALGGSAEMGRWPTALPRILEAILPWATATAVWFLALAVPQAILQDGVGGARSWTRFMQTAAVAGSRPRLGSVRFAVGELLTHAAVLGWPPLVAAVLSLPSGTESIPPLAIAVALLVGAGAVAAVVAGGARLGVSQETLFSLTLALASMLFVGAWHWRATAAAPISPSLPILGVSRP